MWILLLPLETLYLTKRSSPTSSMALGHLLNLSSPQLPLEPNPSVFMNSSNFYLSMRAVYLIKNLSLFLSLLLITVLLKLVISVAEVPSSVDGMVMVMVVNPQTPLMAIALEAKIIPFNLNNPTIPTDPPTKCAKNLATLHYSATTGLIILTNLMLLAHSLPISLLLNLIPNQLGILTWVPLTILLMICLT